MVKIRKASKDDYNQGIADLYSQLYSTHLQERADFFDDKECVDQKKFDRMCEDNNYCLIVAEDKAQVVGLCEAKLAPNEYCGKKRIVFIINIIVAKNYRNQTIAKEMIFQVERWAKKMNAERIDLQVWGFNESAIAFYRSIGMNVQRYYFEKKI